MVTVLAAVFGLLLGSFLSVLVERWHTKEGIVAGRSRCPLCMHTLAWYDLVPLLSWLWLRGRCRHCSASIPIRYPVIEAVMAFALGGYVWLFGFPLGWQALDLVILFGLVALLFFDLRWFLLPDVFTFGLSGLLLLRLAIARPDLLVGAVASGAFLASLFGLLYLMTRGKGVGLGDLKMGVVVGLIFGFPASLVVTTIAIWAGAITGVALWITGRATRKTPMPFGSFWAAAAVLAILWPEPIQTISSLLIIR